MSCAKNATKLSILPLKIEFSNKVVHIPPHQKSYCIQTKKKTVFLLANTFFKVEITALNWCPKSYFGDFSGAEDTFLKIT